MASSTVTSAQPDRPPRRTSPSGGCAEGARRPSSRRRCAGPRVRSASGSAVTRATSAGSRRARSAAPTTRTSGCSTAHVPRSRAHRPGVRAPLVGTGAGRAPRRTRPRRTPRGLRAPQVRSGARASRMRRGNMHDPHNTQYPQNKQHLYDTHDNNEESDVLRRAFMTSGATVAAASLGPLGPALDAAAAQRPVRRAGAGDAGALEEAVRRIRLLDDRHGADGLYRRAAAPLRTAYALLDAGATRQATADRLYSGAGELAISVGWLAHDSGRFDDARSHYAEALATSSDDRRRGPGGARLLQHGVPGPRRRAPARGGTGGPGRAACRPPPGVGPAGCPCSRCARRADGRGWPTASAASRRWPARRPSSGAAPRTPTPSG